MSDPDNIFRVALICLLTVLILFLVVSIRSFVIMAYMGSEGYLSSNLVMTSNSYIAPRIPYYPETKTLGVITKNLKIDNIVETLDCMVRYESGGNPLAYNPEDIDGRPKYGLLQFDADTFQTYCVGRYGYKDDIWDMGIQYLCADQMLREGLGWHWPTIYKCLTN